MEENENVVDDGAGEATPDPAGASNPADDSANAAADAGGDSSTPDVADDDTAGTVPEALKAVGGDPEAAREALETEGAKEEPRTTLTKPLEAIVAADDKASAEEAREESDEEAGEQAPGGAAVAAPPAPSMTDIAQTRMVESIEVGRENRAASLARNRALRDQQQVALGRTNRPDNESKTQAEVEDD